MDEKSRHLELAGVVKNVHSKLRIQYKNGEDLNQIWSQHCQNTLELSKYADAMHELATEVWTSNNTETRIDWCKKTCSDYFHQNGLQKALDKDLRKIKFHSSKAENSKYDNTKVQEVDSSNSPSLYSHSNSQTISESEVDSVKHPVSFCGACSNQEFLSDNRNDNISDKTELEESSCSKRSNAESRTLGRESETLGNNKLKDKDCTSLLDTDLLEEPGIHVDGVLNDELSAEREALYAKYGPAQYNKILLPFKERIRLLDVGSCYNPFKEFKEFISVAIDISPAVKSVYHCDFLHLETMTPLQLASDTIDSVINCLKDPIEKLPEESFHVVVFSLLLEYFPSAFQRWICCEKAHKLLMINGLLLIITPDSHHQNKNAPMMKSWKNAIESMGFKRWKYEKQEHLHCMAFRKVKNSEADTINVPTDVISPDMLYIPQDLKEESVSSELEGWMDTRSCDDSFSIQEGFTELPDVDDM